MPFNEPDLCALRNRVGLLDWVEIPSQEVAILGLCGPVKSIVNVCCGVRSKRDHSSGTRPSVQTVSDVCLKLICSLDTSAFSALEVLDDNRALQIYLLTYLL